MRPTYQVIGMVIFNKRALLVVFFHASTSNGGILKNMLINTNTVSKAILLYPNNVPWNTSSPQKKHKRLIAINNI